MKKCKSKLFKKVLSLALVCAVCSQFSSITGAATEKTTWSLYFSPTRPSAESLTTWRDSLITYSTVSKFNITSIPSGVKVNLRVPDALSGSNKTFSGTVSGHPVSVRRGRAYTYIVKYVDQINSTNRVKGSIVH